MRRSRVKPDNTWPSWCFSPDGHSAIFQRPEDVPPGWTLTPGAKTEVYEAPATVVVDREELVAKLVEMGVDINPIWGNGHMKRIIEGDISPAW